jgi:predicted Co/Zn/Cd cation transporter (cation efflux family)
MPRWLHFILGFLTLIALAVAVVRAALRTMPGDVRAWFARWSYEALVLMLAAAFVTLVVLLTRKGKAPRTGDEP